MALPLVPLVVAAAGSAAASRLEGAIAAPARLRRNVGYGTCERLASTVIIVTEEGTGRVYAYPYASRELADTYFESITWRSLARIMFSCRQGIILEELRTGGLHRLPYKTIRTAATNSNLHEQVFIQRDGPGFVSYHFVHEAKAFISYESPKCAAWLLDDGQPLPARKPFEEASFDTETRTFRGVITWTPTTFLGDQRWEYEMVFDTEFTQIVGGQVHHFTPGVTDRNSTEQVQYYGAATKPGAGVLQYTRWIPDMNTMAGLSFAVGIACEERNERGAGLEEISEVRGEEISDLRGASYSPSSSRLISPVLRERIPSL